MILNNVQLEKKKIYLIILAGYAVQNVSFVLVSRRENGHVKIARPMSRDYIHLQTL